jgi:HlyD family secretion protein
MSSSPIEAVKRRLASRRGLVALVLAGLLAASAYALLRKDAEVANPLSVLRDDLVQSVEVEGELVAVHSTEIGTPPVQEMDFKISFLAPEGQEVKKGQPVLGFDTEALERQLQEKQAELAEATKKAEQKQVELRLALLELEQQTAQAQDDLERATLKAEVPADVQQRIELEKAKLQRKGRERDLENLKAEKRATISRGEAELRSLHGQRDRARGRVEALQAAIEKLMVKAPQDGIVIYRANRRDEKKKVGDSTWFGETILAIPDLSQMMAEGFVDEADGGTVATGQQVTLRLEARPDLDLRGRVRSIGHTVRQKSWRTPVKVYKVEVALDKTDTAVMRPSMRFRGEIETARVRGLLLVPRDSVFLRDGGPVVWAQRALGWKEVPVVLGRSNRKQVEVKDGLAEGDRLSPIDLALPEETRRAAARGPQ